MALSFGQVLAIVMLGLSIGWLTGLSVSPVVGSVIAGLLGLLGGLGAGGNAIASILGNARTDNTRLVDLRPVALLAVAIAVAAPMGILARTNGLFGTLDSAAVREKGVAPGLYAEAESNCAELIPQSYDLAPRQFRDRIAEQDGIWRRLAADLENDESLVKVVRILCSTR